MIGEKYSTGRATNELTPGRVIRSTATNDSVAWLRTKHALAQSSLKKQIEAGMQLLAIASKKFEYTSVLHLSFAMKFCIPQTALYESPPARKTWALHLVVSCKIAFRAVSYRMLARILLGIHFNT